MKHLHRQRSAAEQAALRATLDRLDWKAWSIILWGLDAGDPKVIRGFGGHNTELPEAGGGGQPPNRKAGGL